MLDRPQVRGSPKMVHQAFLRGKRKSKKPPKLISTSDCMWEAASRSLFWARRLQYAGDSGGAVAGRPGHFRPHGGRPAAAALLLRLRRDVPIRVFEISAGCLLPTPLRLSLGQERLHPLLEVAGHVTRQDQVRVGAVREKTLFDPAHRFL